MSRIFCLEVGYTRYKATTFDTSQQIVDNTPVELGLAAPHTRNYHTDLDGLIKQLRPADADVTVLSLRGPVYNGTHVGNTEVKATLEAKVGPIASIVADSVAFALGAAPNAYLCLCFTLGTWIGCAMALSPTHVIAFEIWALHARYPHLSTFGVEANLATPLDILCKAHLDSIAVNRAEFNQHFHALIEDVRMLVKQHLSCDVIHTAVGGGHAHYVDQTPDITVRPREDTQLWGAARSYLEQCTLETYPPLKHIYTRPWGPQTHLYNHRLYIGYMYNHVVQEMHTLYNVVHVENIGVFREIPGDDVERVLGAVQIPCAVPVVYNKDSSSVTKVGDKYYLVTEYIETVSRTPALVDYLQVLRQLHQSHNDNELPLVLCHNSLSWSNIRYDGVKWWLTDVTTCAVNPRLTDICQAVILAHAAPVEDWFDCDLLLNVIQDIYGPLTSEERVQFVPGLLAAWTARIEYIQHCNDNDDNVGVDEDAVGQCMRNIEWLEVKYEIN